MITGSKELIRDINTKLVLDRIRHKGPISRATISKQLGLTKATISSIVQVLLDKDLVLEIGSDNTKKGRKPILLQFNQGCGYVISLDLSAEFITLMTADLNGQNCSLKRIENQAGRAKIIPVLGDLIENAMEKLPDCTYGVVGISLGIHGVVHENIPHFVPYSPYAELDFAQELTERLGIPVLLENEANLAVLGEWNYSYHTPNMLSISVHSGIGLGIIMNNELIRGQNGLAGEFGHSIISVDGRPCPCGNRGCLETYASERALLKALSKVKGEEITPDRFADLYQAQDPDAMRTMDDFIKYISVGINNLLNTINPEIIVVNSSFTMNFPEITKEIHGKLHNFAQRFGRIEPSLLQDTAILLGGVTQCVRHFIEIL